MTKTGYDAQRAVLCACGWGGIFPGLRAAVAAIEEHKEIGCEGCDHVVSIDEHPPVQRSP